MALAVHLFPAVGSDQHAINVWPPEHNMSEMCGVIVEYSFLSSRLVSQQMKAKTYEVCNREKVEWRGAILIVSNCSDLKEDCNI